MGSGEKRDNNRIHSKAPVIWLKIGGCLLKEEGKKWTEAGEPRRRRII